MKFGMEVNIKGVISQFDSNFTTYRLAGVIDTKDIFNGVQPNVFVSTKINVPVGYEYLTFFSRGDCYVNFSGTWHEDGKTYNQAIQSILDVKLDENRNVCISYDSYKWYYIRQFVWIVFYPSSPVVGNYGITISGERENFSSISEISKFTSVVWSGDVIIPISGLSPSDIDPTFKSDYLCFFWWNDDSSTIGQVYDYTEWQSSSNGYGRYYAYNSGGYLKQLSAKMVIFGEKQLDKENYGMEIYNENQEVVFSLANPTFRKPEFINMSDLALNKEIVINKIKHPMIAPRSIGGLLYRFTNSQRIDRAYYDIGFSNTGNSLVVRRSFRDDVIRGRHYGGSFFSKIPFPVLDASYYFNFDD